MKITMLGCGASAGVPLIGCNCEVCTSKNPKNRRTRPSIFIEDSGTQILIDTSPDLRQQSLASGIRMVDAILYTHDHADHTHGIDDVRSFNFHKGRAIDIYGNSETIDGLMQRFPYAFKPPKPEFGWFRPSLNPHILADYHAFTVGSLKIQPFLQLHGQMETLGFRIGNFAYSVDTNEIPAESLKLLEDIEIWIVDCLKPTPAPTHAHLERTLQWVKWIKPKLAVLTHMSHEMEYDVLSRTLPESVVPGYDGMVMEL